MGGTAMSQVRARQEIRCTFCCWPAGRSPEGRGGGRASAALPLLDDATTSPASRRLASARPALAPKCTPYVLTGLYLGGTPSKGLKVAITGLKSTVMSITHSSLPRQAPLQPAKVHPEAGVALRVTTVPGE